MKHFDHNHHGFHSLELAYAGMVHLGKYVNEEKKRKENADRVEDLQSCMTGWSGKDVSHCTFLAKGDNWGCRDTDKNLVTKFPSN